MTHSFAADHATPQPGTPPEPSTEPSSEPGVERSAAGTALGAFGMVAVVGIFALLLHTLAQHSPQIGPGYGGWPQDAVDTPWAAVRWFLGDMTEPLFYKSDLAGLGLLAGVAAAWWAGRRGAKWAGSLSYGTGLWPWVLASASMSLILSNLVFGWMLDDGWQPTFVPFVCVAPALVLMYGAGWRTCITGAVLGAVTTTPLALLFIATVSEPFGLPAVVGSVLAMSVGSVISFLVARRMPWLVLREPPPGTKPELPPSSLNRN